MNDQLKKITKPKRVFPNDDSVLKLIYLGIRNISKKWTMPIRDWSGALNQFAILFFVAPLQISNYQGLLYTKLMIDSVFILFKFKNFF